MILSVVISYILKAVCSIGHEYIYSDVIFSWSWRVVILSVFAVISSIVLVMITEWKRVNDLILKVNHKSIHDDIWHDVVDYKNGTTLRVVCNDAIYTGILVGHEEKGNESWFVLEDYIVKEDDITYKSGDIQCLSRLALNLNDVKRVELFYGNKQKSKLRLWLEKNKFFKRFFEEQEN